MTNREFSKTREFEAACREHNIKATKRQASKFMLKKGRLYKATLGHLKPKGD